MDAYMDMKSHRTPIPTPPGIRLVSSMLVGASVGFATTTRSSAWPVYLSIIIVLVSAAVAVALPLRAPYRSEMTSYAEAHNVSTLPSIAQLIPLMIWWTLLMIGFVLGWPWWGGLIAGAAIAVVAFWVFPHVDGTRRLAFA